MSSETIEITIIIEYTICNRVFNFFISVNRVVEMSTCCLVLTFVTKINSMSFLYDITSNYLAGNAHNVEAKTKEHLKKNTKI